MTLLIRNVQIVGSDQKLPDKLDVFVSGEKIAAIGRFPGKRADEVIDGQGGFLFPGFVDVDTESDHYLSILDNPEQTDFLKQGVTTIIGGLCGASLAPLLYGSLESIEEWADIRRINVDWHTMKEFLAVLQKKSLGINFGSLVGHSTIRQAIISGTPRNLTKNELLIFQEVLKRAISEGGFGLSTGLGYVHSQETPYAEIKFLAKLIKQMQGVYATHLRDDAENLLESLEETIKIAEETEVKTLISHFVPVKDYEKEYETALSQIESLDEKIDLHFSLYPSNVRILKLYTFLPKWAQKDDLNVMMLALKDEWLNKKIIKDFPKIDPKKFIVAQATNNESLVGFSLFDLKKLFSLKNYEETLLKLMLVTNLKATIFYENIDPRLIKLALTNRHSFVASNAASFKKIEKNKTLKPERVTSTFIKFLNLVLDEKLMTIDDAIRKITLAPALKFNIPSRGVVKSGYFADLVGFRSSHVDFVVLNGQVVVRSGEFVGSRFGKVLKSQTK